MNVCMCALGWEIPVGFQPVPREKGRYRNCPGDGDIFALFEGWEPLAVVVNPEVRVSEMQRQPRGCRE